MPIHSISLNVHIFEDSFHALITYLGHFMLA